MGAAAVTGIDHVRADASPAAPEPDPGAATILTGPGIDPTGRDDSSVAVQARLDAARDGETFAVPSGATLRLDRGLVVRSRITLTGSGELRFVAGIANGPALVVRADGCTLRGLHMTNPNGLGATTGPASFGVLVSADAVLVDGCRLDGFQTGIAVAAQGEFHDVVLTNNRVMNVLGAGGGRGSTTAAGEDRGDGIVVWGASAVVSGNRVTAKPGTDARIGIHLEALDSFARTPYGLESSMISVLGNVVSGPFRRGIVDEGVTHASICANAVADATWWGIALIGSAHHTTVVGNTIRWTRTAADDQGGAWDPLRSGLMVYDDVHGALIADNVVHVDDGASLPAGITLQASRPELHSQQIVIDGNLVDGGGPGVTRGVYIVAGADAPVVRNNRLLQITNVGIDAHQSSGLDVTGNSLTMATTAASTTATSTGVAVAGADASSLTVTGNTVTGATTGIRVQERIGLIAVTGNVVQGGSVAVDLAGCGGTALVSANLARVSGPPFQNLPPGTAAPANASMPV